VKIDTVTNFIWRHFGPLADLCQPEVTS